MQRKGVKNDNSENGKLDRHENGNVCDDNEMSAVGMVAERQSDILSGAFSFSFVLLWRS